MKYKKYIILLIIIVPGIFTVYHSVYFEKLDARKQKELVKKFNPKELVGYFWKNELNGVLKTALPLTTFDSLLKVNPVQLIKEYGKTVGISNNYCFLISGTAEIISKGGERIVIVNKGNYSYKLLTKYIFSSIARDVTGFFKVDDFENTMDFNAISTELNGMIMNNVGSKLNSIPDDFRFRFTGALGVNAENIPQEIEIVPLEFNFDVVIK